MDNKAQIIWSWENSIRNAWVHTEIFRLQALMSWQISAQFEALLRFLLETLEWADVRFIGVFFSRETSEKQETLTKNNLLLLPCRRDNSHIKEILFEIFLLNRLGLCFIQHVMHNSLYIYTLRVQKFSWFAAAQEILITIINAEKVVLLIIFVITVILSGSHSHRSHHQRHSPDPNPLIIDHRLLSPLIKSTISLHSSRTVSVWSQTLYVYLPDSHLHLSTC